MAFYIQALLIRTQTSWLLKTHKHSERSTSYSSFAGAKVSRRTSAKEDACPVIEGRFQIPIIRPKFDDITRPDSWMQTLASHGCEDTKIDVKNLRIQCFSMMSYAPSHTGGRAFQVTCIVMTSCVCVCSFLFFLLIVLSSAFWRLWLVGLTLISRQELGWATTCRHHEM